MTVHKKKLMNNQQGFASLVVALTLIVVLSLVTVGFARLIRREQTNALNKQLSTQAFYAAESGLNDIIQNIGSYSTANTDCRYYFNAANTSKPLNGTVDPANGVSYTCALIDTKPGDLFHGKIGDSTTEDSNTNSWTIHAQTDSPLTTGLKIKWNSYKSIRTNAPGSKGLFLARDQWSGNGYVGLLRFTVTPAPTSGVTRQNLISGARTYYLYPTTGSAESLSYGDATGSIKAAQCATDVNGVYSCSITLTGLNSTQYLFHIVSIYDASDITLSPADSGISFINTQAVIDVTGKAQDVLRRIQVRYPLQKNESLPNDAIEVQDVCKRIAVSPTVGATTQYGLANGLSAVSGATTNSARCNVEYLMP